MFDEAWSNEESITNLKQWIPNTNARLSVELETKEWELISAVRCAEEARRVKESHGTAATPEIKQSVLETKKAAKSAEGRYRQAKRGYVRAERLNVLFRELNG
jgi:hypothetical protein